MGVSRGIFFLFMGVNVFFLASSAVRADDWRVVRLKASSPIKLTADQLNAKLMQALQSEEIETARHYLKLGANLNAINPIQGRTPLQFFSVKGDAKAVEFLIENHANAALTDPSGANALIAMAKANTNSSVIIEALLKTGIDVDAVDGFGLSALTYYVQHGNHAAVTTLLSAAPHISLRGSQTVLKRSKRYMTTPLWFAASSGFTEIVALLLTKEPTLLYQRVGLIRETALMAAAKNCRAETVKTILEIMGDRANINLQNSEKMTATMFAAKQCCLDATNTLPVLLEAKPDLSVPGPLKMIGHPDYGIQSFPQTAFDFAACPANKKLLFEQKHL